MIDALFAEIEKRKLVVWLHNTLGFWQVRLWPAGPFDPAPRLYVSVHGAALDETLHKAIDYADRRARGETPPNDGFMKPASLTDMLSEEADAGSLEDMLG